MFISRNNGTIIRADDFSPPDLVDSLIPGYFTLFDTVFNPESFGSIAQTVAGSPLALGFAQLVPDPKYKMASADTMRYVQNFLVLPLLFWQAGYAQLQDLRLDLQNVHELNLLPNNMATTISLGDLSWLVLPGRGSLYSFALLFGSALVLCVGVFLYAVSKTADRPSRIGFSTLDFAINCLDSEGKDTLGSSLASLRSMDPDDIAYQIRDMQVSTR
jgi:hypothetical protein